MGCVHEFKLLYEANNLICRCKKCKIQLQEVCDTGEVDNYYLSEIDEVCRELNLKRFLEILCSTNINHNYKNYFGRNWLWESLVFCCGYNGNTLQRQKLHIQFIWILLSLGISVNEEYSNQYSQDGSGKEEFHGLLHYVIESTSNDYVSLFLLEQGAKYTNRRYLRKLENVNFNEYFILREEALKELLSLEVHLKTE